MTPSPSLQPLESSGSTDSLPDMARPTIEMERPPYLVPREDGGRWLFHYQVPKRLRPPGWPGAIRLPIDSSKRTGRGDSDEAGAAIEDAKRLYARLTAERKALEPVEAAKGTIVWLVERLTADDNPEWTKRPPASKRTYLSCYKDLKEWSVDLKHPPLVSLSIPQIVTFLGGYASQPPMQHLMKSMLRSLYRQAKLEGLTTFNPIDRDIPLQPLPDTDPVAWPEEAVEMFCAHAVKIGRRSLALAIRLKWWTGIRNTDLIALQIPDHVLKADRGWVLRRKTSKRKRFVGVPLMPDVVDLLEAEIGDLPAGVALKRPLLVNENIGRAYTTTPFERACRAILAAIGYPELEIGHLRHTVMTEMEDAGVIDAQSAAVVGHSPSGHKALKERAYRITSERHSGEAMTMLADHRAKRREQRTKV